MNIYLRRREFIAALGGAAAAWPLVAGAQQPALPDIPSLSEFLPGYESDDWKGIGAPKGTPF